MTLVKRFLVGLWIPLLAVVVWQVVATLYPHPFFTEPLVIARELWALVSIDWIIRYVWPTVALTLSGYVTGSLVGVTMGILIGSHPLLYQGLAPLAVFIRSIPSAAIIPVVLALWGIGPVSLFVSVVVAISFQVALVTMLAVYQTPADVLDTCTLLGMSKLQTLVTVRIPSATGQILTGLQAALQVALLVAVTAETLGGGSGMGRFTSDALDSLRLSHMWVSVVVLGLIGVVLHHGFAYLERRLAPWYFGMRKSVVTR